MSVSYDLQFWWQTLELKQCVISLDSIFVMRAGILNLY